MAELTSLPQVTGSNLRRMETHVWDKSSPNGNYRVDLADILSSGEGAVYPEATANIPKGVTGTGTIVPGSGGTDGTFALAWTGGNFTANPTGTFTVSAGRVIAAKITSPGVYIGASPTAPSPVLTASASLSGASIPLTVGELVKSGETYWADHASDASLWQLYRNVNGTATAVASRTLLKNGSGLQAIADAAQSSMDGLSAAKAALGIPTSFPALKPVAGTGKNPACYRSFTPTNGNQYDLYAKFPRAGLRYVQLINTAAAGNGAVNAMFDCQTDTATAVTGTAFWRDVGGGFVEFWVRSATVSAASAATWQLRLTSTGSLPYNPNGTDLKAVASFELRLANSTANLFTASAVSDAYFTRADCDPTTSTAPEDLLAPKVADISALADDLDTQLNGAMTATKLAENGGTTNNRIYRNVSFTNGAAVEFTIIAKAVERKWLSVTTNNGAFWSFALNLQTGEYVRDANLLYAPAIITASYQVDGYWKFVITVTATATATANAQIAILNDALAWLGRAGTAGYGVAIKLAQVKQAGVTLYSSATFGAGSGWTADGATATDNSVNSGALTNDIKVQPKMVDARGLTVSALPDGGDELHGMGPVTLNGFRHIIPRAAGMPDLNRAFRAAFATEIAEGAPILWAGDSITWGSTVADRYDSYLSLICSHVNQGSPDDEPLLHALEPSLLAFHGITYTGTVSTGSTGPLGASLVMAAGAVLTFSGKLEQIGLFYDQAAGAGTLTVARGGTTIATINTSGTTDLDHYSGAIATGTTSSATYTITCSVAAVTLTGLDRLGVKAAGSLARVRFVRWAHGSYAFNHFADANFASVVKQCSAYSATKPPLIIALGINDRNVVGTGGYTGTQTRLQQMITDAGEAGITSIIGQMALRTSAAADSGFFASGLSYDLLIGAHRKTYRANGIPTIGTDALDLSLAGKMASDGIHPIESGHVDVAYYALTGVCRARGVI